MNGALTSRQFG